MMMDFLFGCFWFPSGLFCDYIPTPASLRLKSLRSQPSARTGCNLVVEVMIEMVGKGKGLQVRELPHVCQLVTDTHCTV